MKALYYNAILGILLSFPSFLKAQIRPFEPLNPDRIFFKGKVVDTDNYNPQNEMFRLLGTKRSFSQNETFFFSHLCPPTLPFSA